jgi:hypothetical protein
MLARFCAHKLHRFVWLLLLGFPETLKRSALSTK